MAEGGIKQVSWNASGNLIMEISNKRSQSNNNFIEGNIKKAFNTLITIKNSVIQSLDLEERKSLSDIEKKFQKITRALNTSLSSSFNTHAKHVYTDAYHLATKFYSEYNEKLMDILEKYGYLMSEKADISSMKI